MTRYMRWLEAERGLRFGDYAGAVALVGRRARGVLGARSGTSSRSRPTAPYDEVLARPRDAGRQLVPGRRLNYAEHIFRGKRDAEPSLSSTRRSCATLGELTWGELRDQVARVAAGPPRAGVGPRRPRRRLPARTSPRRWSPSWRPRRSARSGRAARPTSAPERRRPLRADRAEGPARRRRLPLRRPGLRPHRDRRRAPARDADARAHGRRCRYLDPATPRPRGARPSAITWDELLGAGEGAELAFERGALRPPALGPLLLRHHRPAEGDRPGPRRHPARAAEEAAPAPRRAARATASSGSRRPAG